MLLIWENRPSGIARIVIGTVWSLNILVLWQQNFEFSEQHSYAYITPVVTGEDAAAWRNAKGEIIYENLITNKRKYSLKNRVLQMNFLCLALENFVSTIFQLEIKKLFFLQGFLIQRIPLRPF